MKTAILLCLAATALPSARAQLFRPEAVNGALLGGIAGAVIGNNSGDLRHNAWKGAAIGAGAGLLLGQAVGADRDVRSDHRVASPRAAYVDYVHHHRPSVHVGISHGYGHGRYYGSNFGGYHRFHRGYRVGRAYDYFPSYNYYPGYGGGYPYYHTGYYGSGSAAANGLLLGALAGGIIGHNSGDFRHDGWRGAAWGAGAGWLLGTIADAHRRPVVYETAPVVQQTPVVQSQAVPAAQPQQVTIINNYYNGATPMSGANSLFGR